MAGQDQASGPCCLSGQSIDQLRVAAEHEAAHAVMYIELGFGVHVCEIYEPGTGFTSSSPHPVPMSVWDRAVIHVAGPLIEDRYQLTPLRERWLRAQIDSDGGDLSGVPWEMVPAAYKAAQIILDMRRAVHERIAAAVYDRHSLTGDELEELLK